MITLHINDKTVYCEIGDNLFDVLNCNGYTFIGNCNKMGRCNACMVYDMDSESYIKSCNYTISHDMNIRINKQKTDILNSYEDSFVAANESSFADSDINCRNQLYGIAIDVGTTTIAMELIDINKDIVIDRYNTLNPQISYGADVISRISYSISYDDGFNRLRMLILKCLLEGIHDMISKNGIIPNNIVIAGNTTMLSIIENYTLSNLSAYPFIIKNRAEHIFSGEELFSDINDFDISLLSDTRIICLPNISAFVGADAAVGAYITGVGEGESYKLLIDLGTNGEIILANNKRAYATSCACGPAFEGCFRSGSMNGASLFDMIAILRKRNIINRDGLLSERYFENGYNAGPDMVVDMELIHSFLLAKAAIGAGIATLINECNITYEDISNVYISGGFGFHLNIDNAIYLGMFPEAFRNKITVTGNTSLLGARNCLIDKHKLDALNYFIDRVVTINMGDNVLFNKEYISQMTFPE